MKKISKYRKSKKQQKSSTSNYVLISHSDQHFTESRKVWKGEFWP